MSTRRVILSRGTMLASSPPTGVKDAGSARAQGQGINVTMRFSVTVQSGLIAVATISVVAGCGGGAPELEVSSQAEREGVGDSHQDRPSFNFEIKTLSNRADLISDGDALVEVRVPRNVPMHKVTLTLNGTDVGTAFKADAKARTLRGVLRGLALGHNRFVAQVNGHDRGHDDDQDQDRRNDLCDADPRLAKHSSPRQVAGGPLAENILKCQLKPLDVASYAPVTFTAAQLARLGAAFPDGACDWSKPGVGQQDAISPLTFVAASGGRPLPPAPVSHGP